MNQPAIIQHLQQHIPNLLGVWAFGSRISGGARADSDLDLAVLVAGYADTVRLFELAGDVHDYQKLHLPIVVSIITQHLDDFLLFSRLILTRR